MSLSSPRGESEPRGASGGAIRVGAYVFFPGGGIGRYTVEVLRALGRLPDVDPELWCAPDFQWQEPDGYGVWNQLWSLSDARPPVRRARFLLGQVLSPRRAARRAREGRFDIVHFASFNNASFPLWKRATERSGARVVISAHDVLRAKAILHRGWEDAQLRAVYRWADALLVHSEHQRAELVQFAGVDPGRVHLVPHGPYAYASPSATPAALRERYGLPAGRQVALFFGQLRDEKGLGALLQAMALADHAFHLLVTGTGGGGHSGAAHYRDIARRAGVLDRVTFLNRFVPDNEVGDVFAAADWVALPYEERFTSQSGVLNVAAHFHKPVLVSPAPVLAETVRDSGIGLVAQGAEPARLAAAADALMRRIAEGEPFPFGRYGERYSWHANAVRTREVYRAVLAEPRTA